MNRDLMTLTFQVYFLLTVNTGLFIHQGFASKTSLTELSPNLKSGQWLEPCAALAHDCNTSPGQTQLYRVHQVFQLS